MDGARGKVLGAVLAALLLFSNLAPIRLGVGLLDDLRIQRAEANPAVAPIVVFGTALAAYGVYVAGSTAAAYDANLSLLYNGYADSIGMSSSDFEEQLNAAVTAGGAIDLSALTTSFFPSFTTYVQGLVSSGDMVQGANSAAGRGNAFYINGTAFPCTATFPNDEAEARAKIDSYSETSELGLQLFAMKESYTPNGELDRYYYYVDPSITFQLSVANNGVSFLKASSRSYEVKKHYYQDGRVNVSNPIARSSYQWNWDSGYLYNSGFDISITNGYSVSRGFVEDVIGVVNDAIMNNSVTVPTETVEPFTPTAAQLEAGYSNADIVTAIGEQTGIISDQTGVLQGILSGIGTAVGSLDNIGTALGVLPGIAAGVAGIGSGVDGLAQVWDSVMAGPMTWLNQWWNSLTSWWESLLRWLGDTPLARLIAEIIAAIAAGVASLEGVLSGVLDGIIEGIADGVVSLVGAIEGVAGFNFPNLELPRLNLDFQEPIRVILPWYGAGETDISDTLADLSELLNEKAPFCYFFAFNEQILSASGALSSNPSFSFQLDIPYSDAPLVFDANPWLLYPVGGMTVAYMIRLGVTCVLCIGIVNFAVAIAMKLTEG